MPRLSWIDFMDKSVCYNESGDELGHLELGMVGRHKHWIWYQYEGIGMSGGCVDEMRAKQKELFKHRKREINLSEVKSEE